MSVPHEEGGPRLRMPAEWEPHDAVWLAWPHDPVSFAGGLTGVERTYLRIILEIHKTEAVELLVRGRAMRDRVRGLLHGARVDPARVRLHVRDYADVWIRDYGPTFVEAGDPARPAMVRWRFNAWGGKYRELLKDARVFDAMEQRPGTACLRPGVVMEGGSFDVNGRGTLITTEQCLLNKNRNPGLGRAAIEAKLRRFLGVEKILWLRGGIAGDDTDGHVDDVARFVAPSACVCALEDRACDENYGPLKANYEALCRMTDQDGRPLEVLRLPMPEAMINESGRLPASYANFYVGNGVVLAPVFGCARDEAALRVLEKAFPGRRLAPIFCAEMISGLGAVHCASQQQPAAARGAPATCGRKAPLSRRAAS